MLDDYPRTRRLTALLTVARLYERAYGLQLLTPPSCGHCGAELDAGACQWCDDRTADAEHLLKPPARRGYGYATGDVLERLGIDPAAERDADLRTWIDDLRTAVDAGLITRADKNAAIRRAKSRQ